MIELKLIPPCTARYGDRATRIAITVYLALRELLAAGGNVTVGDLCEAVWGERGDVPMERVWSLCFRVNARLRELDCPVRFVTEDGEVSLL